MDTNLSFKDNFGIREDFIVVVSDKRYSCLVPTPWIEDYSIDVPDFLPSIHEHSYKNVHKSLAAQILAMATANQNIEGFTPVSVYVVKKQFKVVESLIESSLSVSSSRRPSCEISNAQIKSHVDNLQRKWFEKESRERYSNAYFTGNYPNKKLPLKEHNDVVVEAIKKLYGREPVCTEKFLDTQIQSKFSFFSVGLKNVKPNCNKTGGKFVVSHPSLHPVYFVAETSSAYFIFQPFYRHTLADVVAFSPLKLAETSSKMFVFTEILMAVQHLHSNGINVANLKLSDLSVNDMLWVRIISLDFNNFFKEKCIDALSKQSNLSPNLSCSIPKQLSSTNSALDLSITLYNLPNITQGWIRGEISNLDYLLILNKFAGRNTNEPNHHPILPWVLDFPKSSPAKAKFRDLSRSKYRLNKGDEQLDLTFDSTNPESMMIHPNQTPFHVSDFLSDISYYVYVARTTPQDVLCRIVRTRWQSNHYPPNMGRLYEWTPDECIPAFYLDPSIFNSCHGDLLDLQLPLWSSSPKMFIEMHQAALESSEVSSNLHHWIDLTFGYKLTGYAAIASKNVCLQLVDKHKTLLNHGVVQLFQSPHPMRKTCLTKSFASNFPSVVEESFNRGGSTIPDVGCGDESNSVQKCTEKGKVDSNEDAGMTNPLSDLEHLENFFTFCVKETHMLDKNFGKVMLGESDAYEMMASVVMRDMQSIGCLAVELFHERALSHLSPDHSPLKERYTLVRNLAFNHLHEFPFFIKRCIIYLLNLTPTKQGQLSRSDSEIGAAFTYPSVNYPNDLPPPTIDILLAPQTGVLTLPSYINSLYHCVSTCHSLVPNFKLLFLIEHQGIDFLSNFLRKFCYFECNRSSDIIEVIVLPYVEFLLRGSLGKQVAVTAAWNLFYFTSKCLTGDRMAKNLLPLMIAIFQQDETSSAFLKIYHRSFVIQLIAVLKLNTFLKHFATPLVEAVSGFKNFIDNGNETPNVKTDDTTGESVFGDECKEEEEEEEEESEPDQRTDVSLENIEVDIFDRGHEIILFDGDVDNEAEQEDSKSAKSGCPSTNSLEEDEFSSKSEPVNQSSYEGGIIENLLYDECNSFPTNTAFNQFSFPSNTPPRHHQPQDIIKHCNSNISTLARETVKWLSDKIGPVLTAKYLSRNLLRMLVICYIPPLQLEPAEPLPNLGFEAVATGKYVAGDSNAKEIAACLLHIACEYGEQVLLIQYLQHIKELVSNVSPQKTLSAKSEGYIISSITLLLILLPHLTIASLIDSLSVLTDEILFPILDLLSSNEVNFSTVAPSSRSFIAFRSVDVIALISIKLGFEMTRCNIMNLIKKLFDGFKTVEKVFNEEEYHDALTEFSNPPKRQDNVTHHRQKSLDEIFKEDAHLPLQPENEKENMETKSDIEKQLHDSYSCELACLAYITFCKLAGGICVEQHLDNDDFIRKMYSSYDQTHLTLSNKRSCRTLSDSKVEFSDNKVDNTSSDDSDVSIEGNKIIVRSLSLAPQQSSGFMTSVIKHYEQEPHLNDVHKGYRHLRGDWLSYWGHEIGLSDKQQIPNVKQIKLQTFKGHSSSVRHLVVMDCENSFISAGRDHTIKLWSIRNQDNGSAIVPCQATYNHHKKSISSLIFVDSLKLVASSDGHVHIWDPFNMTNIRKVASLRSSPISVLACSAAPSTLLLASSNDSIVRLIDCRTGRFSHYLKTSIIPSGIIKSMTMSDDGNHVAVGFSTGIITTLDIRSGHYLSSWKAYDSEIQEMKILDNKSLVAFSMEMGTNIWSFPNGKLMLSLKGTPECAHWINYWNGTLVFGYSSNKIVVCPNLNTSSELTSVRLKNDLIKGSLSCLSLLPLNHLFLLGSDYGDITLIA